MVRFVKRRGGWCANDVRLSDPVVGSGSVVSVVGVVVVATGSRACVGGRGVQDMARMIRIRGGGSFDNFAKWRTWEYWTVGLRGHWECGWRCLRE